MNAGQWIKSGIKAWGGQRIAAKDLGISDQYLSDLINGRRLLSLAMAVRIAVAYDLDLNKLK